jgi:hypothetical protein
MIVRTSSGDPYTSPPLSPKSRKERRWGYSLETFWFLCCESLTSRRSCGKLPTESRVNTTFRTFLTRQSG